MPKIGVLGGSGLYKMEGMSDVSEQWLETPYGEPSDCYMLGVLDGIEVAFLPRHARGHQLLPSELNARANIYGFKLLGVEWLIAVGAVGSLKEEIHPLDIVMVDQFVDRTNSGRKMTFFGEGVAAHIGFADPVCPVLHSILLECAELSRARVHPTGTYINMEGPAFSTRAESKLYRSWGMDVIGMTNLVEAKLAREAEICYATMAMVTDYDVWHEEEDDVSIGTVIENLTKNAQCAENVIRMATQNIPQERTCDCPRTLDHAMITDPSLIPESAKDRLRLLLGDRLQG